MFWDWNCTYKLQLITDRDLDIEIVLDTKQDLIGFVCGKVKDQWLRDGQNVLKASFHAATSVMRMPTVSSTLRWTAHLMHPLLSRTHTQAPRLTQTLNRRILQRQNGKWRRNIFSSGKYSQECLDFLSKDKLSLNLCPIFAIKYLFRSESDLSVKAYQQDPPLFTGNTSSTMQLKARKPGRKIHLISERMAAVCDLPSVIYQCWSAFKILMIYWGFSSLKGSTNENSPMSGQRRRVRITVVRFFRIQLEKWNWNCYVWVADVDRGWDTEANRRCWKIWSRQLE